MVKCLHYLVTVTIRKWFTASFTFDWLLRCVQLLYVDTKIRFSTTRGRAKFTLENWLVSYFQAKCFKNVKTTKHISICIILNVTCNKYLYGSVDVLSNCWIGWTLLDKCHIRKVFLQYVFLNAALVWMYLD